MNTYNISLNKELANLVDEQLKKGRFANRSEFFRQLLRHAFFSQNENEKNDWIYSEPFYGELKNRITRIEQGQEKMINSKSFDKEFNF
jgi:Arc/MetJ-type ribon-helix-helix transcriptional regulator